MNLFDVLYSLVHPAPAHWVSTPTPNALPSVIFLLFFRQNDKTALRDLDYLILNSFLSIKVYLKALISQSRKAYNLEALLSIKEGSSG